MSAAAGATMEGAHPPLRPAAFPAVLMVMTGIAVAAGFGLLSAWNPAVALAAAAGLAIIIVALWRPAWIAPLLVVTIFGGFFTVGSVTANRLAAPVAGIAIVAHLVRTRPRLNLPRPIVAAIAAYSGLAFASLLWTLSRDGTVFSLSALAISLLYAAAFAVLVRNQAELRLTLWTVAICSGALGLWWIGSYAAGVYRADNSAGDPNFVALLQLIALPLITALAAATRSLIGRVIAYILAAITGASVIATLSRGGVITLLVVGGLLALIPAGWLFGSRRRKAGFLAFMVIGLALTFTTASGDLLQRFQSSLNPPAAAEGRGNLDLAAIHGFQDHPVLGMGFGAFKPNSFDLLRTTPGVYLEVHLRFQYLQGQPAHNAYLETLSELGVPGLALFITLLAMTGLTLLRCARRAAGRGQPLFASVPAALLVGLVATAVSSLSLSTETSRQLWLVIGLALTLPGMIALSGAPPEHNHVRGGSRS